jgi:hypothetical protein
VTAHVVRMQDGSRAVRKGREYWQGLVSEFEAAPCRHGEFAARHGVRVDTFRQWLYRVRAQQTSGVIGLAPKFIEVGVAGSKRIAGGGCTVLAGQVEVRFEQTPSAQYLGDLLARAGR